MPTLVKEVLGGGEIAITAYLAIFAVDVAIGSAIAAWLSAGRFVLLPAVVGMFLMGLFGFDLAWVVSSLEIAKTTTNSLFEFFAGDNIIRVAIDLAGLAIAGSFLVVPTFTAVQTWVSS